MRPARQNVYFLLLLVVEVGKNRRRGSWILPVLGFGPVGGMMRGSLSLPEVPAEEKESPSRR